MKLHATIGDYLRQIDEIKAGHGPARKLSPRARIERILAVRSKIRKAVLTLQKGW
jgi:hypothetical protein